MAFWNPWNFKIIDVVSDFPFSGPNPDYDRICVVCSKARSSHASDSYITALQLHNTYNTYLLVVHFALPPDVGEDLWRKSHWREAIQLHKVWQELLKIKTPKVPSEDQRMKETMEVSGAFPHHYSWKESQWREASQVH